ncbi:MAG: trypsin-like peptidase domain-containing protein [Pirellulales bacterium]
MVSLKSLALLCALSGVGQASGETVLYDFTMDGCAPCRAMEPVVSQLAEEGHPVQQVHNQQQPDLVRRFNVQAFPTFVMVVNGREVDRLVGMASRERLTQMLAKADSPSQGGPRQTYAVRGQSPDDGPAASIPAQRSATALAESPFDRGPRGAAQPAAAIGDSFDARLIQTTVRLKVDDAKYTSYGTGTIIDSRSGEALVLTCGHIFRESEGKGPITVDVIAGGTKQSVSGQMISYDLKRDIGLVSIRPQGSVQVAPVAGPEVQLTHGDRVWSVGCNGGDDPTVQSTRVTGIDRYSGPPNVETAGMSVEGRSGGGLFDQQGRLVGVCFAADEQDDEGLYSAAASIHAELDRLGLSDIYRSVTGDSPQTIPLAQTQPAAMPEAMTARGPQAPAAVPPGAGAVAASATSGQDALAGLSPDEQTALAELSARSAGAEIICIIRPKQPGAKSEILVLDNASSSLIERISAARQTQDDAQLTSMDVSYGASVNRPAVRVSESRDAVGWGAKR